MWGIPAYYFHTPNAIASSVQQYADIHEVG